MSNAELIYAAVVVFIGLPAALRNWTAAALVLSYAFMQGSWYGFHLAYPVSVSVLADVTVIMMIYAKQPACDLYPYRSRREQLAAFWLERSFWDRLIIAMFPVGWVFYLSSSPWWPLYWVSLAQLLAAALEAFEKYRSTRTAKRASAPDHPSSGFLYAPGRENRGYG